MLYITYSWLLVTTKKTPASDRNAAKRVDYQQVLQQGETRRHLGG